jgi:hypothetical protein
MQVKTKGLADAIENTTMRVDDLKRTYDGEFTMKPDLREEIVRLYSLWLTVANAVAELQREHNG